MPVRVQKEPVQLGHFRASEGSSDVRNLSLLRIDKSFLLSVGTLSVDLPAGLFDLLKDLLSSSSAVYLDCLGYSS